MKKIIFSLLLFVLVFGLITGCTRKDSATKQPNDGANQEQPGQEQTIQPDAGMTEPGASAEEIVSDVDTDQLDTDISELEKDLENW